jgi:hypothetical protein
MSSHRVWRVPRLWSNQELRKIADHFHGEVVNVSAWRDEDKCGGHYREYFRNATGYTLTNYKSEARGFQGADNEIFLDLAQPLDEALKGRFDVVFNHTTLEHIFEVQTAFANLCAMSRDAVILVLPFVQEQHGEYGDFWRFTPDCLARLFRAQGLTPLVITSNRDLVASSSVGVAVRDPARYARLLIRIEALEASLRAGGKPRFAGRHALPPLRALRRWWNQRRHGRG